DISYILAFQLKGQGHHCVSFTSVEEAQKHFDSGTKVDAVICDYHMPKMDGLEFFEWLRQQGHNLPFFMLTGEVLESQKLLDAGVTDVLHKPDDLKKLAQLLKKI